jgi:zinc D-Ala-D-Ala carboxypeptidase
MLSAHFSMAEFVASQTAARRGIDNDLPAVLLPNARATCGMLERIRAALGALAGREVPIYLSSGYRGSALNAAVGGKGMSDHLTADAADWLAPSFGTPAEICEVLAPRVGELGIGQLINEFPPGGWVHTSTRLPAKMINRIITINQHGVFPGVVA